MFISAFDLDHTLLSVNSSFEFGKYLFKNKHLSFPKMLYLAGCYAAHKLNLISVSKLHHLNFTALFKGKSTSQFQTFASAFLDQNLSCYMDTPALSAFQQAASSGHNIIILSSSPDFLVNVIAQRLGVKSFATTYHTDSLGAFSHLGSIMDGTQKANHLHTLAKELHVSKENTYAYTDSHLDLPFLEAAGHAIAVRPTTQLKKISLSKGWNILS